jgi:hypothetical protein
MAEAKTSFDSHSLFIVRGETLPAKTVAVIAALIVRNVLVDFMVVSLLRFELASKFNDSMLHHAISLYRDPVIHCAYFATVNTRNSNE